MPTAMEHCVAVMREQQRLNVPLRCTHSPAVMFMSSLIKSDLRCSLKSAFLKQKGSVTSTNHASGPSASEEK